MTSSLVTRERLAVSLLFLLNGFIMGSWATRIPLFAEKLGLQESILGVMILVFGIGSIVMMPVAGSRIARFGSRRVSVVSTILYLPTLLLAVLAPNIPLAAVALFLFGGLTGAMDVAMNANAVETEKAMGRSIMSSCHAFWSLGGLFGAGLGGWLITAAGPLGHVLAVTVIAAILFLIAWPMILADAPHPGEETPAGRLPLTPLPWLIGLVALFSMVPEGAVLDWGALYLGRERGADVVFSGYGYAAFSLTMAIMRFAGDLVRDRFGAVATLRGCGAAAMAGLLIIGFADNNILCLFGFALAGIGISNLVPIAFSAAGNLPGLAPGVGLSVVTTMGYSGILVAPSLIGFIAQHTSLGLVFRGLPLLLLVVLLLSGLARHADRAEDKRAASFKPEPHAPA
ncbi:MFS transporter [Rhizobium paknamense]|uniref:MFS family permease n=1 Tax=Rhizobium paknamense TaxID=1206817 RepID=A0ABU0IIX5_9HYPH|nr:MFS transporter [Rhizobium paknamense]MDQ0457370.1 MFS family permease [Rhizobium paknamense]